eukprot:SAG31_NODE_9946_length_1206_cov_23.558266_1_plen_87_part_10
MQLYDSENSVPETMILGMPWWTVLQIFCVFVSGAVVYYVLIQFWDASDKLASKATALYKPMDEMTTLDVVQFVREQPDVAKYASLFE